MLKIDYTGSFARATVDVLGTYLEHPAKALEAVESGDPNDLQEVAVIIGITGEMEGRLLLEFDKLTALKLCEALNFGDPFPDLNQLARSTLAELGNLIAGRAVTLLNDNGARFSITPPVILCGIGMKASGVLNSTVIPVATEIGRVMVNVAVRQQNES